MHKKEGLGTNSLYANLNIRVFFMKKGASQKYDLYTAHSEIRFKNVQNFI